MFGLARILHQLCEIQPDHSFRSRSVFQTGDIPLFRTLALYNARMKLVGIEIHNYACFERQFIAIQRGLNLLVGKNNAGKTSLLKAIAAVSAIPLERRPYAAEEVRTFINGLIPYLRTSGAQGNY